MINENEFERSSDASLDAIGRSLARRTKRCLSCIACGEWAVQCRRAEEPTFQDYEYTCGACGYQGWAGYA